MLGCCYRRVYSQHLVARARNDGVVPVACDHGVADAHDAGARARVAGQQVDVAQAGQLRGAQRGWVRVCASVGEAAHGPPTLWCSVGGHIAR